MPVPAPGPAPVARKEVPQELTPKEMMLAGLLQAVGLLLIVVVAWILASDGHWLTEETATSGEGAQRTVTTRKYSDTVPLAALGVGGALILCGVFFGRIREVKLPGGTSIKLDAARQELEQQVEQQVRALATRESLEPEEAEQLKAAARAHASAKLLDWMAAEPSRSPPPGVVREIADAAVTSAKVTVRR